MAYKLLLADDSITIQKVVELVLAEEDFQIKSVSNGEDALNLLGTFRPDIVLADIEMPKVNGYNLCDKIKKNPSTSHVPVILLAGAFEPVDEELARQVGADDTVIKPFESQELISKINAALAMGQAAPEAEISGGEEEVLEAVEEAEISAEAEEFGLEEAGLKRPELRQKDWKKTSGRWKKFRRLLKSSLPRLLLRSLRPRWPRKDLWLKWPLKHLLKSPCCTGIQDRRLSWRKRLRGLRPRAPLAAEVEMPSKEEFLREFQKVVDARVGFGTVRHRCPGGPDCFSYAVP